MHEALGSIPSLTYIRHGGAYLFTAIERRGRLKVQGQHLRPSSKYKNLLKNDLKGWGYNSAGRVFALHAHTNAWAFSTAGL